MAIDYVVCAAGAGTRFHQELGDLPKPLIRLQGATLLEWSLRSLPIGAGDGVVVITQAAHGVRSAMEDVLRDALPEARLAWIELPGLTRGQLETAIAAAPYLAPGRAIAIYNCDTYFESDTLPELLRRPGLAGVIPCSQEAGDAWSFCAVDAEDRVLRVAEKARVGPWATAGLYVFGDSRTFLTRARAAVEGGGAGELYVAPLYQEYVDRGEEVRIDRVRSFRPMGTPAQIADYWGVMIGELRAENR